MARQRRDIRLYINCHRTAQLALVKAPFTAFDGTRNARPAFREWQSILDIHARKLHAQADYCGLLSAKFEAKSGISGTEVVDRIARAPGYDIYLFDPCPQYRYYGFNVWTHVERKAPGLVARAQLLLDRAGAGIRLDELGRSTPQTAVYGNYWVASPPVWDAIMAFVKPLVRTVEDDAEVRAALMTRIWNRGLVAPCLPFVFELFVSTFLMRHPEIRAAPYPRTRPDLHSLGGYAMEPPVIAGFADLIDGWEPVAPDDTARRGVLENLNRVVHEHFHAGGENDVYPW